MTDYLHDVFDDGGYLSSRLPGYARRRGQTDMAWAVDSAITQGEHLVVEAPQGTGRSIAYLVPAIHHVTHGGGKVVIAVASAALREQLIDEHLPFLADTLPWPFSYALMKGSRSYLCRQRLEQELPEGTHLLPPTTEDMDALWSIQQWGRTTTTGDVSELPVVPPARIWSRFSAEAVDCPCVTCAFGDRCFARQAREQARQADVVVCSYDLLLSHVVLRSVEEDDVLLPPHDVAILDEAHLVAGVTRDFHSRRITLGEVKRAARSLERHLVSHPCGALEREAERFFSALGAFRRSRHYRIRLRRPGTAPSSELVKLLAAACDAHVTASDRTEDIDESITLRLAGARCRSLARGIEAAMALADPSAVHYLDEDRDGYGALCREPVDVSSLLRFDLFGATRTVVVTSATLSTGGSFELVKRELGIPEPRELVVESHLDHAEQALLVVPADLPEPNDASFPAAAASRARQVVELAGGRTLGLFSSYSNILLARDRLRDSGFHVLAQGDASPTALVRAFCEDTASVLLSTESFWAGVDVPGESPSCVIVDRLPFPQPDDPVLDAIREMDRQWFMHYGLPKAILAFKQSFDRLIRTPTDRGVVVVLDRRLLTRPYGRLFLACLPPVQVSQRIEDIRAFLGEPAQVETGA